MSDSIPSADTIASEVSSSSPDLEKVITGSSEAAGAAFEVESIGKFKLHKDNPTQIPISKK